MRKIIWQSRSQSLHDSFKAGNLLSGSNGGNAYDFAAANSLIEFFNVEMDESAVLKKGESFLAYWLRLSRHRISSDVIISEPSPIVFGRKKNNAKTVAMVHHVDDDLANSSLKHRWFFRRLKKRLANNVDLVITVSKHWEEYLSLLGCKKIKVIYNSFNPADYHVSQEEVQVFMNKYNFNQGQPLVYIGNAHRQKGVYETYEALKDKNYQLVMTGSTNQAKDLPVHFLSLNRRDYIILLKASNVVITLSKMVEGWNRIAHEAMLCKTPVIGSGTGGMKELLENSGQVIVKDPQFLAQQVERVLQNRIDFSAQGFNYVKKFDIDYFNSEWRKTILELTGE